MRAWPRSVVLLSILLSAPTAFAQPLGGGNIVFETQLPNEDNPDEFIEITDPIAIREFFNIANCECGTLFNVEMDLEGEVPPIANDEVELWIGNQCENPDFQLGQCCTRSQQALLGACPESLTPFDAQVIQNQLVDREIPVTTWIDPVMGNCFTDTEGSTTLYAFIDAANDGEFEGNYAHVIEYDAQLPPVPLDIELDSGEEAVVASWDLPTGNEDIEYFQLLCAREDGTFNDADDFPRFSPQFRIASNVCPELGIEPPPVEGVDSAAAGGVDAGPIDASVPDAGPQPDAGAEPDAGVTPPAMGIYTLDPDFVCGDAQGTATSIRVDGLENGVEYRVILAVIDPALNARFIDLGVVSPAAVTDFWEDYKNEGGTAEGGFCFVATASYGNYDHPFVRVLRDFRDGTLAKFGLGRAFIRWYYRNSPGLAAFIERHPVARAISAVLLFPLVVAAGIWEYTGLLSKLALLIAVVMLVRLRRKRKRERAPTPEREPARRRTRKLAVAVGAGVLALLSLSAVASAQSPWWENVEGEDEVEPEGTHVPDWNFELKFGPYTPDVDSEFSMAEGPFERMFGDGPFLMTQIELERFFFRAHGQLGIGATLGFLGTSANAFNLDAMGNTDFDSRSEGDKTKFRLIPTSLHAVYRYTDLDEELNIPLVPYVKGGLSYYIWYVTAPSGDIARVDGDKARGGSFGFQGTVGLALRAERFDPDAEISLRTELGISHAGIFAELTYAQVDGFGSDSKLSVGDLAWFGGINFEF